jgi:hypothetical protein
MLVVVLSTSLLHMSSCSPTSPGCPASNGCLAIIPKCEHGAYATENVMGVARWICLRCMANYQPVVNTSGQDNILQCGER